MGQSHGADADAQPEGTCLLGQRVRSPDRSQEAVQASLYCVPALASMQLQGMPPAADLALPDP